MRRAVSENSSAVGHDSFLDIVTNMVGILIILVMVVGMRIRNAPATGESSPATQAVAEEYQKELATERSLHGDVLAVARQLRAVQAETAVRSREREMIGTAIAALERQAAERREQLGSEANADLELRSAIANAEKTLGQLRAQTPPQPASDAPVVIENYPTPMAKLVDGPEVHFQLRGGRLAQIPVETLLLLAREDMRGKLHDYEQHRDLSETANTVGPRNGFRFRYNVQRYEENVRLPQGTGRREGIRMVSWTVIPTSSQLGETVNEALADGSQFRQVLAGLRPDHQTVTVWVYNDSFNDFRELRKELHRLGFPAAARPLPDGVPIAGSIDGTKSVAE